MKITMTKLLFIATLCFLVMPLVFTGAANAYVGQTQCLKCHEPVSHPGEADKTPFLETGHSNMLRKVTPGVELLGPNGGHYTSDIDWTAGTYNGVALYYIWDGWLGFTEGSTPRTAVEGGSYTCGSCHTTGYSPDPPGTSGLPNPPASITAHISVTGSWVFDGVTCERCHGEATYDENAVTDGSTALNASYLKYRQRQAGATDSNADGSLCDSADRVDVTMYSNDYASQLGTVNGADYGTVADAHFYDINGNAVTPATGAAACDHPRPRGVHHGGTYNSTTSSAVSVPADMGDTYALCGECHVGSHANGVLNSPHARFTGTWGQLSDDSQYDTHFASRLGCSGCHDVHESLVVDGQEPFHNECGVSCHSYIDLSQINHPMYGNTPIQDLGDPQAACEVCHMKGSGNHLFRINIDPSYSYEIDATTPEGAAECVAQGGHVGSSHGATVCMDDMGAHLGRFYPEDGFAEAEWVDIDQACGQCHGGSGPGPDYSKVQLATLATNIHNTFVETPDFTISNTSTNLTLRFTPTASSCPSAVTCTYSWDYDNDGTNDDTGTTGSVTHQFPAAGTYQVTMTVSTSAHTSGSVTKGATAVEIPTAPTGCEFTTGIDVDQATKTATFTDTSSDGTVYVNWGDGSGMEIATPGTIFTHTYMNNGRYIVRETVRNEVGMSCTANQMIVVAPGQGTAVTKSDVTITASGYTPASMSCILKNVDEFGVTRTRYTGSALGDTVVISNVLYDGSGTAYDVYCYLAFDEACPFATVVNPTSITVNSAATPVSVTTSCTP
jgi:PKD repeat protein